MHINLGDASIFFDVVGAALEPANGALREKPTLLVLHGGPGYDQMTLRPYFDRFADSYQVIYLDHRGCGRSTGAASGWHLDQWADDIAAFCAALGLKRPHVFGQSFGGMVAMHYAARHPDGPERLILSSTAARFLMDETAATATRLGGARAGQVARDFFTSPSVEGYRVYAEVCLPLYNRADRPDDGSYRAYAIERPEVAVHFFTHEMMDMDLRPGMAAIPCPTLVLGGTDDPVTPARCSEEIAAAIGDNAELRLFEGCGHGVHRDEPERAEAVMRAFLAGS